MSEATQVVELHRAGGRDASVRGGRAASAAGRPPLLGRTGGWLVDLFPPTPEPPWPRVPATVVVAHIVALCVGSVVLLARYVGKPPWDILYAEDGWVFLRGALQHPGALCYTRMPATCSWRRD